MTGNLSSEDNADLTHCYQKDFIRGSGKISLILIVQQALKLKQLLFSNNIIQVYTLILRPHLMKYSRFNSMPDSYFIILFDKLN